MKELIDVVVADDSPSVRRLLAGYFRREDGFRVVASVEDGGSAVEAVERCRPDVVTLDVDMPEIDGLTALRQIMASVPTPTVMISGLGTRAAERTLQALEEGAVDFVLKYNPGVACDGEALRHEILAKVRAAAGIRTVRTLAGGAAARTSFDTSRTASEEEVQTNPEALRTGVVVVGASTGGPVALRHLLSRIPDDFPQPIVVVQHIPDTFIRVLAAQLARHTSLEVHPAADAELLRPGVVLIAPGDVHLLLASDGRVHHHAGPAVHGHRPAIDIAMQSAARAFGGRACGVLLTGMGRDGAEGLRAIQIAGGRTFAQDEASSVVWGMPRQATEQGSVDHLAPPEEIARHLLRSAPSVPQHQGISA